MANFLGQKHEELSFEGLDWTEEAMELPRTVHIPCRSRRKKEVRR